ncbi:MAG: class I SAM-dependent methyltransferase [Bacteroidota bacterium]|nr:class I SAM-dependent methyltransferase [Bacteroidota bacterium]MDP4245093.1 class I SAM-dependent methyltransferase [Bacteroidota bacterium]MDP4252537.1 class I SAM-dependent methyltransferase [Bacteroidota bacterium]MDP4257827.1 class I SAM-dependent methyltransferase [Bacteroidota bacterium]
MNRLRRYFPSIRKKELEPAKAYDQWAEGYDDQPGNLMLALDEQVCSELMSDLVIRGKIVADVGCGTGRHWARLLEAQPARLAGYDVSPGMLGMLQRKYPGAETHLLRDERLPGLADETCDLVLSTLTVAHIDDIASALQEWRRVLRPGGSILITDYHPDALARGGQRTFRHNDRVLAVRNHIHPLDRLKEIAGELNLRIERCVEKVIDDAVRPYYEQQQALALYDRFYGVRIIYGLHLIAPGP